MSSDTRWTAQGAGGRFIGSGKMGSPEGFEISIDVSTTYDGSGIQAATGDITEFTYIVQDSAKGQGDMRRNARDASNAIREQISPVRSVSWDLILMGRSLSILNTTFGHNNEMIRQFTGLVYGAGAAMRIVVTTADFWRIATELGIVSTAAATTAEGARTAGLFGMAGGMATLKAVLGDPTSLLLLGIGVAATAGAIAAIYSATRSYQHGGVIPETGVYTLHKGETVIPSGNSLNIININMTTGGISSNVDVDNMLDAMALRMTQESRRRLGT